MVIYIQKYTYGGCNVHISGYLNGWVDVECERDCLISRAYSKVIVIVSVLGNIS